MEKFYVIEGMKPAPEPVEVTPVMPIVYEWATTFKITETSMYLIIKELFDKKLAPIKDYSNTDDIFEELFYGTNAVMVQRESGDVFDMTFDNFMDAIGELVSAGKFKLAENYVVTTKDEKIYDDIIDSMQVAYELEMNDVDFV